jgi:hypothetical protein
MTSVVGLTEILTVTVTPTPGSVQDTNLTKVAGTAVTTGTGTSDAGTQRIAVSSDSQIAATQSGTWNLNNISGTVSLPTGAATAAKQPALGTAGTASADVLTVQGIASMTALKVDGSSSTQPVSGTVSTKTALTANSPTFATVGVTSAQAVASNASRKGLILINTSTGNISIGFGVAAVLNSGITLYPNGTFFMDEYMYTTAAVNAIAANASSNLAIQEWQ